MPDKQTQAINVANQIITMAAQLKALYDQAKVVQAAWDDNGIQATLEAQPTISVNPDGSPGTADATPVAGNPMTNQQLQRSVSASEITQLKSILDATAGIIEGNAAPATPGIRAALNNVSGG